MSKILKNYFYNLSYQILMILVPIITTPYISRVLGAKGVGTFSYTNSIVQYFILFGCVGLNLYGQREIAYFQHQKEKRDEIFWELVILRSVTVCISLIIFFAMFTSKGKYADVFIIMSLDIIAAMIDISWFFQGVEDFKKIVVRNFVVKIVGVVCIFLFVKTKQDLLIYVLCHSVTIFLGNLSMWLYVPTLIDKVELEKLSIKRHVRPVILLFLPQIATSVYTVLDKTMIGVLTGIEEEVAFYEQAQKIIKIILTLVTSLGTVMMPRIANLFRINEIDKMRLYLSKSFQFVLFFSFPMMFGLIAIAKIMVPWFFGPGYTKVAINMMVIAPIIVTMSLSGIIGSQYLLPTGKQKEYTISVLVGCFVNIVMNILLIPRYFSIGAAIATIIAEGCVTIVQVIFTKNDFNYKNIFKNTFRYIISAVVMLLIVYNIAISLKSTVLNTCVCVCIGGIIYVCILLIMRDNQVIDIINKIKNKSNRN